MRPVDVTPAIAEKLLETEYSVIKIADPAKFKIGDSVWTSTIFEKIYKLDHRDVSVVNKMQHTNPITYLLEDYRGISAILLVRSMSTNYIALLIQTCISWRKYCAGRRDKVYVKWLGFAQFMDTQKQFHLIKFWFVYFSTYKKYINISIYYKCIFFLLFPIHNFW